MKSKYKGVVLRGDKWLARMYHKGMRWQNEYDDERAAAIGYDKKRIELGMSPINVLKVKQ